MFAQPPCQGLCSLKTPAPQTIEVSRCELEFKELNCDQFEPAEFRKTCCPEEIKKERSVLNPLRQLEILQACHQGAVSATADFFQWVDDSFTGAINAIKKKNEWYELCDLKCKRDLTRGDSHFDQMSDETLNRQNIVTIEHIWSQRQNSLRRLEQVNRAMKFDPIRDRRVLEAQREREKSRPNMTSETTDALQKVSSLFSMAQNLARREISRAQCVKAEHYSEMICYGLFTIIDPTLAASLLVKSPRLARLVYNQADRLVAQGRRGELLPSFSRPIRFSQATRARFIQEHLSRDLTSVADRERWIQVARSAKPQDGKLFFDTENSLLKYLNDNLKDKDLVTSLNNRYMDLVQQRIKALEKKYGNQVEIMQYSDYKSFRAAFMPKPPLKKVPEEIERELSQAFKSANHDFVKEIQDKNLIRETDRPDNWMRAGIGSTADEANLAARTSRYLAGPNNLQNFSSQQVSSNLQVTRDFAEQYRASLEGALSKTPLLDSTASGKKIPSEEVFEVIRKSKTDDEVRDALLRRYAHDPKTQDQIRQSLTDLNLDRLRSYKIMVDHFSPGMWSSERKIIQFDSAEWGGFTADFAGLGAKNLKATAEGLSASQDLRAALLSVREAEGKVTAGFKKELSDFDRIAQGYTSETVATGDDFAGIMKGRSLTAQEKQKFVDEVSRMPSESSKRISFFGPGVQASDRLALTTHGEGIEKELRQILIGKLPPEKLRGITFAMDMKGTRAGQGPVSLIIGQSNTANLTQSQIKNIQDAFKEAVNKFNQQVEADKPAKRYLAKP